MGALETEIEIRVYDLDKVRSFLADKYGKNVPDKKIEMRDQYFRKAEFDGSGQRYRLRSIPPSRPEIYVATIKKPKIDASGVQSALENERKYKILDDAYIHLGISKEKNKPWFDEILVVEQYKLDGFHVDLRRVKGLFDYVEVEGDKTKIIKFAEELRNVLGKKCEDIPEGGAFGLVRRLREI